MNKEQCQELATKYHVYMTLDGRISIAGINAGNVEHLAASIHAVSK